MRRGGRRRKCGIQRDRSARAGFPDHTGQDDFRPTPASLNRIVMTKASNVILVHGAWADGSSWSKVIPLLLNGGLRVTAVQLPLISLRGDVATVARAVALEDGPMILVGHSYGGVVITEAGNDPKVAGIVYIAAFAP